MAIPSHLFPIVSGLLFLLLPDLFAQAKTNFVAMSFENDALVIDGGDTDYTVGLELQYGGELANGYFLRFCDFPMRWFMEEYAAECKVQTPTIAIGAPLYTPEDLRRRDLITTNRPYSSLLYFDQRNVYIPEDAPFVIKTGALFGLQGTLLAEEVQTVIHEASNSKIPRGWDNQVGDGGRPTLMYTLARSDILFPFDVRERNNRAPAEDDYDLLQVWSDLTGTVGYRTGASARLNLALGRIQRPYHSHGFSGVGPAQFSHSGGGLTPAEPRKPGSVKRGFKFLEGLLPDHLFPDELADWIVPNEIYFTASASFGGLLYDGSLSGYPWDSKFRTFQDHMEHWRDSYTYGLTVRWGNVTTGYQFKSDSNELDFSSDRHEYGLIYTQFQTDF